MFDLQRFADAPIPQELAGVSEDVARTIMVKAAQPQPTQAPPQDSYRQAPQAAPPIQNITEDPIKNFEDAITYGAKQLSGFSDEQVDELNYLAAQAAQQQEFQRRAYMQNQSTSAFNDYVARQQAADNFAAVWRFHFCDVQCRNRYIHANRNSYKERTRVICGKTFLTRTATVKTSIGAFDKIKFDGLGSTSSGSNKFSEQVTLSGGFVSKFVASDLSYATVDAIMRVNQCRQRHHCRRFDFRGHSDRRGDYSCTWSMPTTSSSIRRLGDVVDDLREDLKRNNERLNQLEGKLVGRRCRQPHRPVELNENYPLRTRGELRLRL